MDFFQQIKTSIFSYWRTFRFIDEHNLWRLLILPAILNLIIAIVIIVMAIKLSRNIVEGMMSNFRFAEFILLAVASGMTCVICHLQYVSQRRYWQPL